MLKPEIYDQIQIGVETFRPNFVIDIDPAFSEDEFQQLRIANMLLRQTGPCVRCKTTIFNWHTKQNMPENEPLDTIFKHRKHQKWGPIFGIYL